MENKRQDDGMSFLNVNEKPKNKGDNADEHSVWNLYIGRYIIFLFTDLFFSGIAILLSLYFRFGIEIPMHYLQNMPMYVFIAWLVSSGMLLLMHFYCIDRSMFNISSFLNICLALVVGDLCYLLINLIINEPLPWGVLINYMIINFVFFIVYRLLLMVLIWILGGLFWKSRYDVASNRVLIIGAGEAGKFLLNKLRYVREDHRKVVGFIDDDLNLWGKQINGVRVIGGCSGLSEIIENYNIGSVIVAVPNVKNSVLRGILEQCEAAACSVRRFADMDVINETTLKSATIRDVSLQDLIGRDEASLDMIPVQELLRGKTVLVTGGAGSIGSEICRQALHFSAKKIIIVDFNENGLFEIGAELKKNYDTSKFETVLGNIREMQRLEEIFQKYKPQIVFHAAAHKHVPMMEINPYEAMINNVIGTYQTAQVAIHHNVEQIGRASCRERV